MDTITCNSLVFQRLERVHIAWSKHTVCNTITSSWRAGI